MENHTGAETIGKYEVCVWLRIAEKNLQEAIEGLEELGLPDNVGRLIKLVEEIGRERKELVQ